MASASKGIITKTQSETSAKKKPQTLREFTEAMLPQIARALPKVITPERFTRIALTALSANPELAKCDRDTFLGGLMQAAQLGLEPNTPLGQAYLIPYRNNKKGRLECQFQIGYKGLLDLAYRSGNVQTVQAHCVYENDEFEYELGLDAKLRHVPASSNRGDMIYVYALFKLTNGGCGFEVMSVDDVNKHASKYSQAFKSAYSPWKTNFDEMAKKTVLKKVMKYAPLKTEFLLGVGADEGISKALEGNPGHIEVEYTLYNETDEQGDHQSGDTLPEGFDAAQDYENGDDVGASE